MSQNRAPICDYCGEIKKEANHWFKVVIGKAKTFITITNDLNGIKKGSKITDACGERCLTKAISQYLGTI